MRHAVTMVLAPFVLLAACGDGTTPSNGQDAAPPRLDAAPDAEAPDAELGPWTAAIERCGNGVDDDGDGLVDEDCAPSLWAGLFAPNGGYDLQTGHLIEAIEKSAGRALPVVQTYRSTSPAGIAEIEPDLALIFAHGAAAHLNVEPAGYTKAQYAAADTDPGIDADLKALGVALAAALALHPKGLVLFTLGAEMNGPWTDWGCLPAATFIGFYRKAHDYAAAALTAKGVDPRRLRWVYGPNGTSYCGTVTGYYPGHAYVDYLGMSAYRHASESVQTSIVEPAHALLDNLGYLAAWKNDRFIVLQTGADTAPDRGAWLGQMFTTLTADPAFLGAIYFSADDTASKWALVDSATPLVPRAGYTEFAAGVAALPPNDARIAGTFEPYFWDVRQEHPQYAEIQTLRAAGVTSGCSDAPPCFCPDATLTRGDAGTFLARGFHIPPAAASAAIPGAEDPPTGAELISALVSLAPHVFDTCGSSCSAPVSRALGGAWITHAARLVPPPPL